MIAGGKRKFLAVVAVAIFLAEVGCGPAPLSPAPTVSVKAESVLLRFLNGGRLQLRLTKEGEAFYSMGEEPFQKFNVTPKLHAAIFAAADQTLAEVPGGSYRAMEATRRTSYSLPCRTEIIIAAGGKAVSYQLCEAEEVPVAKTWPESLAQLYLKIWSTADW